VTHTPREAFLAAFRWQSGHADVWRAFEDGPTLAAVVQGLAEPWLDIGVTRVVGVESRGFLLGGAVAIRLGVGFQAVRKAGALFPGSKRTVAAAADYRGAKHVLSMQDTLGRSDVILMVDDWAERGSQALAVRELVEQSGATFAGIALIVDQLPEKTRALLGSVTSLVPAEALGEPDD